MVSLSPLVVICLISGVLAQNPALLRNFRTIRSANETSMARIGGDTPVLGTDLVTLKWLVTIVDSQTISTGQGDGYGPGVIVAASWVVAHVDLHSAVTDVKILRVYANTLSASPTDAGAIARKVKSRYVHADEAAGVVLDQLQLFKVCPTFDAANIYTVPATPVTLTTGDLYKFYNFEPTLSYGEKKIGEDCECVEYVVAPETEATVTAKTFCGEEHATILIEATDKYGAIAVKGTDFIGINVDDGNGGDLYIEIGQYQGWIATNAV